MMISTNTTFIVANTHLYWNPFRPDIKVVQTHAATEAINQFIQEVCMTYVSSLIINYKIYDLDWIYIRKHATNNLLW